MEMRADNAAGAGQAIKPGVITEHAKDLYLQADRLKVLNDRIDRSLTAIMGPRPQEVSDKAAGTLTATVPSISRVNAATGCINMEIVRLEQLANVLEHLH